MPPTCTQQTSLERIYETAKAALNTQLTLDPSIPAELGCAEAVSTILKRCEYDIPANGIPGTATLYAWLKNNPLFRELVDYQEAPKPGTIIISPAGTSSVGFPHGHVGIVARFGVLANDSNTGLFRENYTLQTWQQFFGGIRKLQTFYFEAV